MILMYTYCKNSVFFKDFCVILLFFSGAPAARNEIIFFGQKL